MSGLTRPGVILLVAALIAGLIGAAGLVAAPERAFAAPAARAEYEGSAHDGTRVGIVVNGNATAVSVVFSFAAVTPGCPAEARFNEIVLANGTEFRLQSRTVVSLAGTAVGVQSVVGFFETLRYASATGAFEFVPANGVPCPPRHVAWRVGSTSESAGAFKFGGGYSTAAGSAIPVGGTAAVGVVSLRTQDTGAGLASLTFSYRQGACAFAGELTSPRFYDAGPSLEYSDGRWAFTIASHATSASGGIFVAADGACPAVALYFTAVAGASVPVLVTPTPGPGSGGMTGGATLSGAVPRGGGLGLVVFGGGTIDQLVVATGCPAASMAVWATVDGVFVSYIPGTTIAAPNAAFVAAFPGRIIPPGTAFLGKCA